MAAIETWLRQPTAQAVAWALLQFVWQGAAVGVLTALALLALRRSAADVRYVVASIGLALMLTLPIVSGAQQYQTLRSAAQSPAAAGAVFHDGVPAADGERSAFDRVTLPGTAGPTRMAASAVVQPPLGLAAIVRVFFVLWIVGVTILTLRLLTGWIWVQRLRTRGVVPAPEDIRRIAARLAQQLHISRVVTLLESSLVDVPTVIGFVKPVVLLPVTALAGLTSQQVEAILAHELAHIRRHDYLVNLLQTLVETVLFYHPAVWWLSRRIRIERENCCDDLAVSLCGDPVAYAAALADLEALRSSGAVPPHHIAMAATGGSLLQRVRRLLGAPSSHSGRGPAWLAATVALSLVGCVAYSANDVHAYAPLLHSPATGFPRREMRELGRAIRTDVHAVTNHLQQATRALRQVPRAIVRTPAARALAPFAGVLPQSSGISRQSNDSNGNWMWSNNGERLEVSYHGTFEFTDDDTDIKQMSAGGSLKISDGKWLGRHSVEIRERSGQLEHLYYVNTASRPYEPEGRAWLRQNLPRFVRNTGIGADTRVARLLKSGGAAAVLPEVSRIESTYVKGIYYKQLIKQASLTPEQYRQVMAQASREMRSSSYELAQLLIAVADGLPADEASRAAYFDAASAISSDYELRRVYSTMLKRGAVSSSTLGSLLTHAKSISSDYELSQLLQQILAQQPLDDRNRTAFFNAVATIDSAYERHRVLSAVVGGQRATDPAVLQSALSAAASLHSDYETSQFLQEVLRQNGVEGPVRAPFFATANTIGSNYERGRMLQAVVRRTGTSEDTLRAVLQSARGLDGYELSQLLQLAARNYVISGDLRESYVSAADRLGDYEQSQVLAALIKSERRK
jgi:beta-lactamase regulating signal transducer with metallopeptidase domain